jgi:hypothetical protein
MKPSCLKLRYSGDLENKGQSQIKVSGDTWPQCIRGDGHKRLMERKRL